MRRILFRLYWKLEKLIHPRLKFSQDHYYDLLKEIVPKGCSWLDIGCGHQMLAQWMMAEERELVSRAQRLTGIDLDWEGMRKHLTIHDKVMCNSEGLPFAADSFDLVTANMVVEHLSAPDTVLREVHRVLRPGGLFVFHTPNIQCVVMTISSKLPQRLKNLLALVLENRKADDVFPTYYLMNSEPTIRQKADAAGFEVKDLRAVSTSAISAMLGPLVIVELLYLRLLEANHFRGLRSNLIATFQKPAQG